MLSCQYKSRTPLAVLVFFDQKKAQLSTIRITEQPILLTMSKINRPGYKFSKYLKKKKISFSSSS